MSEPASFERLRAITLAAMMVISVVTVGVGFTSNVLAQQAQLELTTADGTVPDSVEPSSTVNISYNVANTGSNATGAIVDVTLPDEWTVTSTSDAGGIYKSQNQSWLWQTINASETRSPTLTVEVPSTTAAGEYNISAVVKTTAGSVDTTAETITVASESVGSTEQVRTTVSAPASVSAGDTFTAEYTIENTGSTATGLILDAQLPAEWTATNISDDGGTYSATKRSWLWQTVTPNATKSTYLTVNVPASAANGTYNIASIAKLNSTTTAVGNHTVTVEADDGDDVVEAPEDGDDATGGGSGGLPAPGISTPTEDVYNPSVTFNFTTFHNATGVIESDDVGVRLRNITGGNGLIVANNTSVPVVGESQLTVPAGTLAGNVTVQAELYNVSNQSTAATSTTNLTDIVDDDDGSDSDISANLTASATEIEAGTTVSFTAETTNFTADEYQWDFDGGGIRDQNTSIAEFEYEYTTPGSYTTTVTAINTSTGASADATTDIEVVDTTDPAAVLDVPSEVFVGENVTFNGSQSTDNSGIANYTFTVSNESEPIDEITTTESTITEIPNSTGEYTASLTVTDGAGNTDRTATNLTVISASPTAAFSFTPSDPEALESIRFNASGSSAVSDAEIVSYEWDFGQGSEDEGRETASTYDTRGTYSVTLTVTDSEGRTESVTQTVSVAESTSDSTPGFGSPLALLAIFTVSFFLGRRQL